METRECIRTRRSIRRFTDQMISDEILTELLEAVRWAPSWGNSQCWEIIVIKDQAIKEKLSECIPASNPAPKGVAQAPVLIAICAKLGLSGYKKGEVMTNKGDWYMFDMGIAAQNLCLAAHDLGLGTVHVGTLDHDLVDEILGLPEDVMSIELIPVGYPAKEGKAPPRKELQSFVYLNKYGEGFIQD